MADDFRYHIDHHGSLVRPPELMAARASGDPQALAAAEDQAVIAAAHGQRRLVLSAVGDGQFRREHFESVVYDHVDGFAPAGGPQPLADAAGIPPARRRTAPAQPRAGGRLAAGEVGPVLATVDRPVFVVLPSPGYLAAAGAALTGPGAVDEAQARGEALAAILRVRSRRWHGTVSPTSRWATRCIPRCSPRPAGTAWPPTSTWTRCWPR